MTKTPVIKLALPEKSINSTNMEDFSLDTRYASMKNFSRPDGVVTVQVQANSYVIVNIQHGLNFFPLGMLWVELTPGSNRWYANPFFYIPSEATYISGNISDSGLGTTNATFKLINTTGYNLSIRFSYDIIGDAGK